MDSESTSRNCRNELIERLWDRLARYARYPVSARSHLVGELTHVLTCDGRE